MTFSCAHKSFTRASNHPTSGYLGRGNVYSDVQSSTYVRPYSQTNCNGMDFVPGRLRDFDLKPFLRHMPIRLRDEVRIFTQDEPAILYKFFHFRARKRTEHGWLLTTTDHQLIFQNVTGPTWRSQSVIEACRSYLDINEIAAAAA